MRFLRNLAILSAAVLIPATSMAVVPDPTLSITPDCIVVVPDGGLTPPLSTTGLVDITVKGTDGSLLGGGDVRLIFSPACVVLAQCSGVTPIVYTAVAAGDGTVQFVPLMGGCCEIIGAVEIEADPAAVTLASYPSVGSPDQDGNLDVDLSDFTFFQAAFANPGTCFDITNCDADVSLADFTVFQAMFTRACPL